MTKGSESFLRNNPEALEKKFLFSFAQIMKIQEKLVDCRLVYAYTSVLGALICVSGKSYL